MKPAEFVDSILSSLVQSTGVDFSAERSLLIGLLDDSANGRAAVLTRLAADQRVADAHYNQALVTVPVFHDTCDAIPMRPASTPGSTRSRVSRCAILMPLVRWFAIF